MLLIIRPDHNLQDVRAKVFPLKRRKVKAPEVLPPVTMPTRRKERSLSSLVVNAPKVSTQTTMTGRRTKAVARKAGALRGSSFSVERPVKREEDSMEDHQESASSPETLNKFTQNKRQVNRNLRIFKVCDDFCSCRVQYCLIVLFFSNIHLLENT